MATGLLKLPMNFWASYFSLLIKFGRVKQNKVIDHFYIIMNARCETITYDLEN